MGDPSSLLRRSLFLLLFILLLGLWFALLLSAAGVSAPVITPSGNIFFYLYGNHEPIHFLLIIVYTLVALVVLRLRLPAFPAILGSWSCKRLVFALAAIATAVATMGWFAVFHQYLLSMDEWSADFQSQLFLAGQVASPLPAEWVPYEPFIEPIFVVYNSTTRTWSSAYLPVHALVRAAGSIARADFLVNPLLAGLSILLIGWIARQWWPSDRLTHLLPPLLLALSPQFLLTSMTGYSMPLDLCLNLLWLGLYIRGRTWATLLTPVVGVVALGVHNPFPHAMFVLPFLLRIPRDRRWRLVLYFGAVYAAGCVAWFAWWRTFNAPLVAAGGAAFGFRGPEQVLIQLMNLGLFASWQTGALVVLFFVGLGRWRTMPANLRDLALGIALTWGFYAFFRLDQGHGWGYRYIYGVLGSVALVAAHGWESLRRELVANQLRWMIAASLVFVTCIELPIRMQQAESVVRPFANAEAFVQSLPDQVVLVDPTLGWYAVDLVRNDPWLRERPIMVFTTRPFQSEEHPRLPGELQTRMLLPGDMDTAGIPRASTRN